MNGQVLISRRSFNERLLENLSLPQAEREQFTDLARKEGAAFGRVLVSRGLLTMGGVAPRLRGDVRPLRVPPGPGRAAFRPRRAAPVVLHARALVVPVQLSDGTLTVAMADPLDADAREAVARATGKRVEVLAGTEEEVREAIEKAYGDSTSSMERIVEQVSDEAPSPPPRRRWSS